MLTINVETSYSGSYGQAISYGLSVTASASASSSHKASFQFIIPDGTDLSTAYILYRGSMVAFDANVTVTVSTWVEDGNTCNSMVSLPS